MHSNEADDVSYPWLWCSRFCSGQQCFQSADVVFFKDTGIVIGVSIHSSFFLRKNAASRTRNEER
ncbi:MAG: hypothetical protein KH299_02230, partial [Firmicutes bacterium]|nr:hypothetical protein [Bacillota bacterium]